MAGSRKADKQPHELQTQPALKRTSIEIPEEDWDWIKVYAVRNKTTLRELFSGFIRDLKAKERE